MEFKRLEINEEFFLRSYRFRKVSEKQAEMISTGKIKEIYEDVHVDPIDDKDRASKTQSD